MTLVLLVQHRFGRMEDKKFAAGLLLLPSWLMLLPLGLIFGDAGGGIGGSLS